MSTIAKIAGVAASATLLIGFTPANADSRPATPPSLVLSTHSVVLSSTMLHCDVEDGSSGPRPCTWNIRPGIDGNGMGLAYWIGRSGRTHYVWTSKPVGEWRWMTKWERHFWSTTTRLSKVHHAPHWYRRALINFDGSTVILPNGHHWSS